MSTLRDTGMLAGAVAGWPGGLDKIERVASFSPNGRRWRQRYWAEASAFDGPRRGMTNAFASRRAAEIDPAPDVLLQLGAWYDPTRAIKPRLRCSYHDMHLALFLTQPGMLLDRKSRLVRKALDRERRTFERVDVVFAMSDWLRDSIIRDCGQDPGKVVTVFTGANFAIPDVPVEREDGPPRFLFVGMRFERKGGRYLLDAFEHVTAVRPDAELWIVGPEQPVREQHGVRWLGRIDRSTPEGDRRMKELYERASAFVMPSVFEPTGNVFLEAMAHALPCVGTQTCAMPEFIADGVSGLLAACGDVEDIARHMLALTANPARSRAMGLEGFRRVRARFNWPTVVGRMVATMEARLVEAVAVDTTTVAAATPFVNRAAMREPAPEIRSA
jgi:glycosyltransferase involved in cell wall biosynthesis